MKVVINCCFGGFGLSPKAEKRYLELKGKECYHYKQTKYSWQGGKDEYQKITDLKDESVFFSHTLTKDLGDTFEKFPKKDMNKIYFSGYEIPRDDEDLITVINELGKEANGDCAELRIVEVPDGVSWHIEEYDGNEHVAEDHQTWY